MVQNYLGVLALAPAFVLGGCAVRPAVPVAMSQPGDDRLSCEEIARQIKLNDAEAQKYRAADRQVENANAAKVVASAVPLAGLAAAASVDLSNTEQIEARSISDRNERLGMLGRQKGCAEP